MNPLSILSLISTVVQLAGSVKAMLDQSTTTQDKLHELSSEIIPHLTEIGATLFPKVAPALQIVAAASAAFDPNITKWVQGSLNRILSLNPPLVVDGIYGAKTKAAVETFQTQLGLKVDGWAGDITQGAIQTALSKLG